MAKKMTNPFGPLKDFDIRFRLDPVDPMAFAWRVVRMLAIAVVVGWIAGNFLRVDLRWNAFPSFTDSRPVPSTNPQRAD